MLNGAPFLNPITVQHSENKNFDAQKQGLVIKRTEEDESTCSDNIKQRN